jgi:3,4-dihydroxy 2-butanone 4-phosphate synthase/GTP cyclohydrolase II
MSTNAAVISRPPSGILERARARAAAPRLDGLPVLTLAWAQSVDGAIALRRGEPTALSGPESRVFTHSLRSIHAGILVGVGTVLADDPLLSVRLVRGTQPIPVILDSRLRTPPTARVLARTDVRPWIFHAEAPDASVRALTAAGARLFQVHRSRAGLDLEEVLGTLAAEGIGSLMIEGGARVLRAFFDAGLPAAAAVTIAPLSMDGLTVSEPAPVLRHAVSETHGRDLVLWGELSS